MPTLTYTETLQTTVCWCGIHLAVPENLYRNAHDKGTTIYCPLGHTFGWSETYKAKLAKKEEELSRERRRLQATRELLAAEERSHSATRGVVTRQKNSLTRVKNGVCPCCNRTFQQLARHMANKHPEYTPEP